MDIRDIQYFDRTAIWEAACGHPDRLARLLRSGSPMNENDREALAFLIEGRLTPPKRGRGAPSIRKGTVRRFIEAGDPLGQAVDFYRATAGQGTARDRLEAAAKYFDVSDEAVMNRLTRPKRRVQSKPDDNDLIGQFHYWCHREENYRLAYPAGK